VLVAKFAFEADQDEVLVVLFVEAFEDTSLIAGTVSGVLGSGDKASDTANSDALNACAEALGTVNSFLIGASNARENCLLLLELPVRETSSISPMSLLLSFRSTPDASEALDNAFDAHDDAFETGHPVALLNALFRSGTIRFVV